MRSLWAGSVLLLLAVLFLPTLLAETPADVKISGYVNDYAGVLSAQDISRLEESLRAIDQSGRAQIAIVTVKNLGGQDIEGFALQVAEGHLGETGANNGLLILVSVEDHKYRFEVGRGIEPYLNDARVGRIGREELVPAFQEGRYGDGLYAAVADVQGYLEPGAAPAATDSSGSVTALLVFGLILFFFIVAIVGSRHARALQRATKGRKGKRSDDNYFMAAMIAAAMLRGGRGGGGFGGGGFSGGGGSFGGGGASGGW